MTDPKYTDMPAIALDEDALDQAVGGAETVHLYLKANGQEVQGETTMQATDLARTAGLQRYGALSQTAAHREIVVVGAPIKRPG